jgi:hypothetical protein
VGEKDSSNNAGHISGFKIFVISLSTVLWLAALLALRHGGAQQYFWRLVLRGSGMNNFLQLQHFFLVIPAIGNVPPNCQCYRKKG